MTQLDRREFEAAVEAYLRHAGETFNEDCAEHGFLGMLDVSAFAAEFSDSVGELIRTNRMFLGCSIELAVRGEGLEWKNIISAVEAYDDNFGSCFALYVLVDGDVYGDESVGAIVLYYGEFDGRPWGNDLPRESADDLLDWMHSLYLKVIARIRARGDGDPVGGFRTRI